ncbi:MAG: MarR family winged helix-turn-helix transcriptional regulator [Candidatus Thiodiazotropha sp.]
MKEKNHLCDLNTCREIGQSCAMFNLRKASRALTQLYEEILKPSGVLPTQFTLLVVTRAMEPVAISRMAEVLVMDRTTLTRNLKPLEREGWVSVRQSSQDKRTREENKNKKGMRRLERALPLWREAQQRIRTSLGESRLDRMIEDLTVVASRAATI